MSPDILLTLTLSAVFLSVALLAGTVASFVLSWSTSDRRRLNALLKSPTPSLLTIDSAQLTETPDPTWERIANALPTSRGSSKRLRRDLSLAGFHGDRTAALFSLAEIVVPLSLGLAPLLLLTDPRRWLIAAGSAVIGYFVPGLLLKRRIAQRQKEIQNGLADALDLLVLCLEAGSSLDQAIVKAGDELSVAYPALGDQLHIVITEMRGGKTRLEAFKGLATRSQVDDVRALVAMLVQTDRFGTSIAQALRTHAEVSRTKRRQRAEERAAKVSVKLVFPLVFCLFPALYIVMLGPAFIEFLRVFGGTGQP